MGGRRLSSPVFAALVAGVYVALFYIGNNVSMLPWGSAMVVLFVLTVPVAVSVCVSNLLVRRIGIEYARNSVSIFLIVAYVLLVMRLPLLEAGPMSSTVVRLGGMESMQVKGLFILLVLLASLISAWVFRKHIFVLSIALVTMAATALGTMFLDVLVNDRGSDYLEQSSFKLQSTALASKPNVYLILADSYSSLAYLDDHGIEVGAFEEFLQKNQFSLYEDVFSSYQTTAVALPALLNMEHHYYQIGRKSNEVAKSGRVAIGGRNNLVRFFRDAGYGIEYIHQSAYLLLSGCSADFCSPDVTLAGAKTILHRILPHFLQRKRKAELRTFEAVAEELSRRISASSRPRFFYSHLYAPGHSPNEAQGQCDEQVEHESYAARVEETNESLRKLIGDIVALDREAVIVLTSDHGPLIEHQCARDAYLTNVDEYRDRAGMFLAVRWPGSYEGQFDGQIRTSVNLFRYVIGALAVDSTGIMKSRVSDDVYVQGKDDFFKILEDGNFLVPARLTTQADMRELYLAYKSDHVGSD